MNLREKEQYLREYSILKAQGKPFFPYAVAKDSIMAVVVLMTIIGMSILFGAELGPKADPTTTTYVPRPEWYFFFLFELLRVIKPSVLVPLATIGIPTICMILLFLLPLPPLRPFTAAYSASAWPFSCSRGLSHGGAVVPCFMTSHRCAPMSAAMTPGNSSMWIA